MKRFAHTLFVLTSDHRRVWINGNKVNKMEKTKMKKKYVSPFMEELGLESEVHLLVTSDRHVNQSVRFDSTLEEKSLDEADDV